MKTTIWISFLLITFLNLTSCCSKKNPFFNTKTYLIQKDLNPNDFILPQDLPKKKPFYEWEKNHTHIPSLTKYSFQCRGTSLEENVPLYKRCLGSLEHGLPLLEEKETIYPRLIELLNFFQKEINKKITIIYGHLCPKAFSQLKPKEQNNKYLIGAMVKVYCNINWENELPYLVKKFYNKKKEEDNLIRIENTNYPLTFINNEFKFIISSSEEINIMEIEVLYNKITSCHITFKQEDMQNYLRY